MMKYLYICIFLSCFLTFSQKTNSGVKMNQVTLENQKSYSFEEYILLPKVEKNAVKTIESISNGEEQIKKIVYLENQKTYSVADYLNKPKSEKSVISVENSKSEQKKTQVKNIIILKNQEVLTREEYLGRPKTTKSIIINN
ncbi:MULTISPECIES: hypothetical protein [unclassified Bizionia]|uniref:hypothetical protein n=2 Tax=Bizionia TaxID=283785 RepID=UPI00205A21D4|nr:hypothetical protein [Bizionia sp. M204]UPS90802.1 hypothetical protein GMA17_03325 [Bizionia sp. M204]